jgi:glycosyltransferase 2 family protein
MAIKIAFALAILTFLIIRARDPLSQLSEKTVDWRFLATALVFTLSTATLSFARWHILVRALGISVRLVDSLRLGALGYALNFVSPGSIGGDFFKAIFLAHGQPGKRTEAVASVVADRALGLLTMLGLASIGILATGLLHAGGPSLHVLCKSILVAATIGWVGFALVLCVNALSGSWVRRRVGRYPLVGKTLVRVLETVQVYRNRKRMLLAAFGVSVMMALCFVTSFYMVARGLPIHEPPWAEHLVIVPVAGLVGAIPLTPSGLGTTEFAIEELYKVMPGGDQIQKGDGTLVGVGRRLTDIAVALVGLGFYLSHRREVEEVFAEAEEAADEE